jgi:hypothetical protein
MIDNQSRVDAGSNNPNKKQSFNHSPAPSFSFVVPGLALQSFIPLIALAANLRKHQPLSSELPLNLSSTWASSLGRTFHSGLALSGFLRLVPNFPVLSSGQSLPVLTTPPTCFLSHNYSSLSKWFAVRRVFVLVFLLVVLVMVVIPKRKRLFVQHLEPLFL